VTGGAGFIGSHTVDLFVQTGMRVSVVDNLCSGHREYVHPAAEFFPVDITGARLATVFRRVQPDYVVHLAAQPSVPASLKNPVRDAETNAVGTLNVLECCVDQVRRGGPRPKVIVAGSAAIYGEPRYLPVDEEHPRQPQTFYGLHKAAIIDYLRLYRRHHRLPYAALVYANVFGPRQSPSGVISRFIAAALSGSRPLVYGDGRQTRDFVFVGDVARANYAALFKADGEVVNVGTGVEVPIAALCEVIAGITGHPLRPVHAPPRPGDIERSVLSTRKALLILNWRARVPLAEGIRLMLDEETRQAAQVAN